MLDKPAGLTGLAVSEVASPANPTIINLGRARLGRRLCPLHRKVYKALCTHLFI